MFSIETIMNNEFTLFIFGYVVLINLFGIGSFFIDKKYAVYNEFRISEKTLVFIALLGGFVGSVTGMYLFRHKNKKPSFIFKLSIAIIANLMSAYLIFEIFFK